MKGKVMKKIVFIFALSLIFTGIAYAGEKEELQWRARALVAEANYLQLKLSDTQKLIQELFKELELKGYSIAQDGSIVEKPKKPIDKPIVPGGEK